MKRRTLLALLVAAAAPAMLQAQLRRVPKVGVLLLDNPQPHLRYLQEALRELGYVDGRTIQLEVRSGGQPDVAARNAADLVRMKVDVIVAVITNVVKAAMQATQTIPIIMIAGAPVETGLVKSLARPGGNVTGVSGTTGELGAKTLQVVKEIVPSLSRLGVLVNADDSAFGNYLLAQVQAAGRSMKIDVESHAVVPDQLAAAFAALAKGRTQIVLSQPSLPRARVLDLGTKHRIPVVAPSALYADAGALLSYATSPQELVKKAASYVPRILSGANPATLAVEQVAVYEFVINMKTARELGIHVPQSILTRADRVIGGG